MEFVLMSKNVPVCKLQMDASGHIENVLEIYNEKYLPVGVSLNARNSLYEWWKGRSIPASRNGLSKVLHSFDIDSANVLSVKSLGLSLTDQYWIKPFGTELLWEAVNFFDNEFSQDIGDAFFDVDFSKKNIDFMSPDNTSDGWLKKKWVIAGNDRMLVKTGSSPFCQEPYNEVIASLVLSKLNTAPYVKYELYQDEQQGACSICKNFITKDTELVSAFALNKTISKSAETSAYEHYMRVCAELGVPGIVESVDTMLVLDYIIANKDRHGGNFGVIRDANTLKYLGAAPIYDSGTSLWYNQLPQSVGSAVTAQPFNSNHEEQVKLVKNWEQFDFGKLAGVHNECYEILSANELSSAKRNKEIANALKERVLAISLLQKQMTNTNVTNLDDVIISKYKKFKYNYQAVFAYYLDKEHVKNKAKYNPKIDESILQNLLKDGFGVEQCKKIILNSPNVKSEKMAELLLDKLKESD